MLITHLKKILKSIYEKMIKKYLVILRNLRKIIKFKILQKFPIAGVIILLIYF